MIVNKKAFDKEAKIRREMVNFERQRILKIIDEAVEEEEKSSPTKTRSIVDGSEIIWIRGDILQERLRKRIKHHGSDLCPQTAQRSTEGLPDGCAEKPKMCEDCGQKLEKFEMYIQCRCEEADEK